MFEEHPWEEFCQRLVKIFFVIDGSKRGRPKKRLKKEIEKDKLARGLKKGDAQNCVVCRLSYKNWPTFSCTKQSQVPGR